MWLLVLVQLSMIEYFDLKLLLFFLLGFCIVGENCWNFAWQQPAVHLHTCVSMLDIISRSLRLYVVERFDLISVFFS